MSDENINPEENEFDASNISDERKAELNKMAEELAAGTPSPEGTTPNEDMADILDDLRNRTDLSEESQSMLDAEDNEPPEWASQSIPLPDDEGLPTSHEDEINTVPDVTPPVDDIAIDDEEHTLPETEEGSPVFDDDDDDDALDKEGDENLDRPEAEHPNNESSPEIDAGFDNEDLDVNDSFIDQTEPSEDDVHEEIIIDEDSFGSDFTVEDFSETPEITESPIQDHAAENDFDVEVDENGQVKPESIKAEAPDIADKSGDTFNPQPLQQPAQPQAQQTSQQSVPMRAPLFGSLGSLFNRNKAGQDTDLNLNAHLERAASRDIEKLSGLQSEHTQLLTDVIKATNPANYNPANEEKVLGLLSQLAQSAKVVEVQSDHLTVTTSNMKDHGASLKDNNSAFAKQTEQLNEMLEENAKHIDSPNIKEALSSLFKNIKDFINKAIGRSNETTMDVS